ncbi:platelet endothelial aggregation receptor 1-like isoform X1 [Tenebrio molitor]|uniref:platelet endothelial aggregation receptor 1-like isoform X1 n=2 Tax=Tenebrio molitor TaxID=7067 RepID=UPI0036247925
MQQWIVVVAVVIGASESRHYYPYTNYPVFSRAAATTAPPYPQRNINDVTVVDGRTGIVYNPYSKFHPGRHVCTNQRNVSRPIRTKHVICKPTYKKYMERCGTQWCEGVRLVYEKYHKEVVTDANHTHLDYLCCPGWTQVNYKSHGCNRPVCARPCINGGKCVRPNVCSCPPGYDGTYCETKTSLYAPIGCGSTCPSLCPPPSCSSCPPCSSCSPCPPWLSCQSCPPCLSCQPCPPCLSCPPCLPCPPCSSCPPCPPCQPCSCCPISSCSSCPPPCPTSSCCKHNGLSCPSLKCNEPCPSHCLNWCNSCPSPPCCPPCAAPCLNGGVCTPPTICICPPGYSGPRCEQDVDECKKFKPCDQICYNTPGSYKCECKENFSLQKDGQSCRKEDDEGTTLEATDLEPQKLRLERMEKRLYRLEKIWEKNMNGVSKGDLNNIYGNIDKISNDISVIASKLQRLESNNVQDVSSRGETDRRSETSSRRRSSSASAERRSSLASSADRRSVSVKSQPETTKNETRCGPNCIYQEI